jgi:hypothetical protein
MRSRGVVDGVESLLMCPEIHEEPGGYNEPLEWNGVV